MSLNDFARSAYFKRRAYTDEELKERREATLPKLLEHVGDLLRKPDKTISKEERKSKRRLALDLLRIDYDYYMATEAPSPMEKSIIDSIYCDRSTEPTSFKGLRRWVEESEGQPNEH